MVVDITYESRHTQEVPPFAELASGGTIDVNDLTNRSESNGPAAHSDPPTPIGFLTTIEVPGVKEADIVDHLRASGEIATRNDVDITFTISIPMAHALSPKGAWPRQLGQSREAKECINHRWV